MDKIKVIKKIYAAAAIAFLLLFVPVFLLLIIRGNNVGYWDGYKQLSLLPNYILFFVSILAVGILFLADRLLKKLPDNRYTYGAIIVYALIISFIMYKCKIFIAENIAFMGGWDCGIVANTAKWVYAGTPMMECYEDYFLIIDINVPAVWLLNRLYGFALSMTDYPYYPEFIWIQYETLLYCLAVFFLGMTALVMTKKVRYAFFVTSISAVVLGLPPWNIIPYTDSSSIVFPVIALFFYSLFADSTTKIRYLYWFVMLLCIRLGALFKPTVYMILIAILAVELSKLFLLKKRSINGLIICLTMLLLVFLAGSFAKKGIYKDIGYTPDERYREAWSTILVSGINQETSGGVYASYTNIRDYVDRPKSERIMADLAYIRGRVEEMGIPGTIKFFVQKSVMNFNDGTFSWYKEGSFDIYEYPVLYFTEYTGFLNSFFRDGGKYYGLFTNISQILWLFLLIGLVANAVLFAFFQFSRECADKSEISVRAALILAVLGTYIYILLFEGRARYLITNLSLLIITGVIGICDLFSAIDRSRELKHNEAKSNNDNSKGNE